MTKGNFRSAYINCRRWKAIGTASAKAGYPIDMVVLPHLQETNPQLATWVKEGYDSETNRVKKLLGIGKIVKKFIRK